MYASPQRFVLSGSAVFGRPPAPTSPAWRLAIRALALALACTAGYWIWRGDPAGLAPVQALQRESSSPWRWCDAGQDFFSHGEIAKARYCVNRALQLAPNIPSIWIQAGNVYFQAGESDQAVSCWIRALELVPDFDDVVFSYFDRLSQDPLPLMNARARQSYFRHLLDTSQMDNAQKAWPRVPQNDDLAVRYTGLLAGHGQPRAAAEAWAHYKRAPLRPVFNGGFEEAPSGGTFDWNLVPLEDAEVARDVSHSYDGRRSLRITFKGVSNVAFHHVWQQAYVRGGRYRFRAMVKTQDVTTDQGIRLWIGTNATEQILGTQDWTRMEANVTLPPGLALVQIRREASEKFDNKIRGTVWVDAIALDRP